MKICNRTPNERAGRWASGAAAACILAGCQAYEPAPLDLPSHRASLAARITHPEPIERFAERLAALQRPAPERFSLADGLSPAEGEVVALFYNADLRMARLEAAVTLADQETAGLWEDPQFGFDAAQVLSPGSLFEYGLTLSLTIPVSGRLEVERDRAGAAHEAALRRIVDAEWSTRARVRSAWAQWTAAAERASLLRDAVAQVERIAAITDRLESAGELTRIDARLIRVERVTVRSDLIAAEREQAERRIALLGLMGLPPDASIELQPAFPAVPIHEPADDLRRLIEANTTLAVRRAEYQTAEQTLRLEIRKQYPDLTIGSGYGNEDDDRLLLGASIPVPILNANRAGIAQARARRQLARAATETTFEQLAHELASARAALQAVARKRQAVETELVPMLDEQARELEELAKLGEVNTLVLLETVTRGYEARDDLLVLKVAEITWANTIARLVGPDSLRQPEPAQTSQAEGHWGGDRPTPEVTP